MIWLSTSAFVLALVAFAFGAAAWIISWRHTRAMESWRSTTVNALAHRLTTLDGERKKISAQLRELEAQTPAKLAAEVAALSVAVQSVADTHRRFAGKVWARIGAEERAPTPTVNGADDPELAALIALQSS